MPDIEAASTAETLPDESLPGECWPGSASSFDQMAWYCRYGTDPSAVRILVPTSLSRLATVPLTWSLIVTDIPPELASSRVTVAGSAAE
jgi:hypothetical protein